MREIINAPQTTAPLDAYGALLDVLDRRNRRVEFTATLKDLAAKYPSDPRVPLFLLGTARSVMQSQRPGHVMFAREMLRKIVQAYPASPAAVDAGAIVRQMEGARGRGRL